MPDEKPEVRVTCPHRADSRPALFDMRRRGSLPLLIGDHVLAELTQRDLIDGWEIACALSPLDLTRMCRKAGERLAGALEEASEPANLVEVATDAAVLFLLGIRRFGVWTPDEIPACTVSYDADKGEETVALSA
jgi:hypothetical protein